MEPTRTPSPDHAQFDEICAEVEDFETLPAVKETIPVRGEEGEGEDSIDRQILASLVQPV